MASRHFPPVYLFCLLTVFVAGLHGQSAFEALLEESGITWNRPSQFKEVPIRENRLLPYEMALRSVDGDMEIRYVIRPLGRIQIDYDDPHGATPDPNHLFPLIFQALTGKLSAGGRSPSREYNQEDVKTMFNADWAAAAVFDVEPDFTREYSGGLMLAMHKNRMADAYVIYLFNDYEAAKSLINENLTTLVFSKEAP